MTNEKEQNNHKQRLNSLQSNQQNYNFSQKCLEQFSIRGQINEKC